MKPIGILYLFLTCSIFSYGQNQNNIWTFANKLGLDFNTVGGPSFVSSSNFSSEGSASVCDASGLLLFYSDGNKVYDNTHSVMPNGFGILGNSSTTQGVAIAKVKGDDSLYFLFTLTAHGSRGDLKYSLVNMKLNSGKGDVVSRAKNIGIGTGFSEKMIIVGSCGKQWLVVHHRDSATFYAYELTLSASMGSPVLSTFSRISKSYPTFYSVGEMKVSKDFTKIALTNETSYGVILYDFNNTTGVVSNRQIIDTSVNGYGLEFSSDGSKLYCSILNAGGGLYQYDLSAGSLTSIRSSKTSIVNALIYGLRLGPDGMIYFKNYYPISGIANNFDRIRSPNLLGTACNYQADFLSPSVGYSFITLCFGNQFQLLLPPKDTIFNKVNYELCKGEEIEIIASGSTRIFWSDGDTAKIKKLKSTTHTYWVESIKDCTYFRDTISISEKLPKYSYSHKDTSVCSGTIFTFNGRVGSDSIKWNDGTMGLIKTFGASSGKFWSQSFLNCEIVVDTFEIEVKEYDSKFINADTIVCFHDSIKLSAPKSYNSYLWSNGSALIDTVVSSDCIASVRAVDTISCMILNKEYDVQFVNFLNDLKDTTSCGVDPLVLDATVNVANANYKWSNLETLPQISVKESGYYSVQVSALGCSQNRYVNVVFKKMEVNIGGDQAVCEGEELTLTSDLQNVAYLWSTGETSSSIKVNKTGTYSLLVSKDDCSGSAYALISFVSCTNCVSFPNTFSPNGDGINDYFKPLLNCPTKAYEFKVYNRWGQEIFQSQSPNDRWDGRSTNSEMNIGVYFYTLKVSFLGQSDKLQFFKGDITLVK